MSLLLAVQSGQAAALEGTASLVLTTAGDLTTAIRLVGTADLVLTTAGALTTQILLAGSADLVLATQADLTAPGGGAVVRDYIITFHRRNRR